MRETMRILSLYRQILRLHQQKLPEAPRSIGDRYVRQEFQAHIKATPAQQAEFLTQWLDYAAHLVTEADIFGIGRDLPSDTIESLSDEQSEQLEKLKSSALKIGVTKEQDASDTKMTEADISEIPERQK